MTTLILQDASIADLVRAAQRGNRAAFGELFQRFERHVFSIALRRLGNYTEAQELCQDVFIQALEKIEQLQTPEAFGGWLRSITHRMSINRIVRRKPEQAIEADALAAVCVETTTPLENVLEVEQETQLRAGLARLRGLDRDTLVAFYVDGRSLLEMSADFQAPLGTIKRRLHVARKRLAEEVEDPLVAV